MVLNINPRVDLDCVNPTQINSNFLVNDQLDTFHFQRLSWVLNEQTSKNVRNVFVLLRIVCFKLNDFFLTNFYYSQWWI